jgi:uncharacterized protein YabN with tetrapyrrole methylase and pyrophosphatase domain
LTPASIDENRYTKLREILGERGCKRVPFDEQLQPLLPCVVSPGHTGRLTAVGLGYGLSGQVTPEARFHLDKADRLLYLVSDPVASAWLKRTWPDAESLHPLYGKSNDSEVFQQQMMEKMLDHVRQGERVCAAFTGHPAIVVPPVVNSVRQAREEGYDAKILPGISIEDCLVAELGIDPGVSGRQLYDATDFLLRPRIVDTTSCLVLLQSGTLGEQLFREEQNANRSVIELLVAALLVHYPPQHEAVIYETAQNPLIGCKSISVPIAELADAPLTVISTIFIPQVTKPVKHESMMRKLDLM